MTFLSYYLCVFVFCCASAVKEHISIIAGGEVSQTDEVMADKRFPIHDIDGMEPLMYDQDVEQMFGGGSYPIVDQQLILKAHNNYRRNVSPSAANMNEMTWSITLAKQAQDWSDGCRYEHPSKTQYPDYNGIGQNLYIKYWDIGGNNPPKPITQPTDKWYDEVKDYHYEMNACNRGRICGHYTQIIWAMTTEVGCGMTFCPTAVSSSGDTYSNAWLVTCNYNPGGNIIGRKPYVDGNVCSQCADGFCKNGLCSDCDPSEPGCECQIECQNCGTRDTRTCSCSCADGYLGDKCERYCEDTHRYCGSNPGWPRFWCGRKRFSFVDKYCPAMCNVCTPGPRQTNC